jgi:acetylglutamate kinase
MKKLRVIKIGGQIIDDKTNLPFFLESFSRLPDQKILVHGGGKIATSFLERLRIKSELIDGRRITDSKTLEVVQMVYAGLINKNIIACLQKYHCRALGLSGADLDMIRAVKRQAGVIDYGFAGDVISVNMTMISKLLDLNIVPVFCSLSHDGQGQMLNTNADTIATELAIALSETHAVDLIFCFEKSGVLKDKGDDKTLIATITPDSYRRLRNKKVIDAGMIPKIDNAFSALEKGVKNIYITHFLKLPAFSVENGASGTRVTR